MVTHYVEDIAYDSFGHLIDTKTGERINQADWDAYVASQRASDLSTATPAPTVAQAAPAPTSPLSSQYMNYNPYSVTHEVTAPTSIPKQTTIKQTLFVTQKKDGDVVVETIDPYMNYDPYGKTQTTYYTKGEIEQLKKEAAVRQTEAEKFMNYTGGSLTPSPSTIQFWTSDIYGTRQQEAQRQFDRFLGSDIYGTRQQEAERAALKFANYQAYPQTRYEDILVGGDFEKLSPAQQKEYLKEMAEIQGKSAAGGVPAGYGVMSLAGWEETPSGEWQPSEAEQKKIEKASLFYTGEAFKQYQNPAYGIFTASQKSEEAAQAARARGDTLGYMGNKFLADFDRFLAGMISAPQSMTEVAGVLPQTEAYTVAAPDVFGALISSAGESWAQGKLVGSAEFEWLKSQPVYTAGAIVGEVFTGKALGSALSKGADILRGIKPIDTLFIKVGQAGSKVAAKTTQPAARALSKATAPIRSAIGDIVETDFPMVGNLARSAKTTIDWITPKTYKITKLEGVELATDIGEREGKQFGSSVLDIVTKQKKVPKATYTRIAEELEKNPPKGVVIMGDEVTKVMGEGVGEAITTTGRRAVQIDSKELIEAAKGKPTTFVKGQTIDSLLVREAKTTTKLEPRLVGVQDIAETMIDETSLGTTLDRVTNRSLGATSKTGELMYSVTPEGQATMIGGGKVQMGLAKGERSVFTLGEVSKTRMGVSGQLKGATKTSQVVSSAAEGGIFAPKGMKVSSKLTGKVTELVSETKAVEEQLPQGLFEHVSLTQMGKTTKRGFTDLFKTPVRDVYGKEVGTRWKWADVSDVMKQSEIYPLPEQYAKTYGSGLVTQLEKASAKETAKAATKAEMKGVVGASVERTTFGLGSALESVAKTTTGAGRKQTQPVKPKTSAIFDLETLLGTQPRASATQAPFEITAVSAKTMQRTEPLTIFDRSLTRIPYSVTSQTPTLGLGISQGARFTPDTSFQRIPITPQPIQPTTPKTEITSLITVAPNITFTPDLSFRTDLTTGIKTGTKLIPTTGYVYIPDTTTDTPPKVPIITPPPELDKVFGLPPFFIGGLGGGGGGRGGRGRIGFGYYEKKHAVAEPEQLLGLGVGAGFGVPRTPRKIIKRVTQRKFKIKAHSKRTRRSSRRGR